MGQTGIYLSSEKQIQSNLRVKDYMGERQGAPVSPTMRIKLGLDSAESMLGLSKY